MFFLSDSGLVVLFEKQGQQGNQIIKQSFDSVVHSKAAGSNALINWGKNFGGESELEVP